MYIYIYIYIYIVMHDSLLLFVIIISSSSIIIIITVMQGIFNYIPETNNISRVYSVAAVLYFPCYLSYWHISTFPIRPIRVVPYTAVFCYHHHCCYWINSEMNVIHNRSCIELVRPQHEFTWQSLKRGWLFILWSFCKDPTVVAVFST